MVASQFKNYSSTSQQVAKGVGTKAAGDRNYSNDAKPAGRKEAKTEDEDAWIKELLKSQMKGLEDMTKLKTH